MNMCRLSLAGVAFLLFLSFPASAAQEAAVAVATAVEEHLADTAEPAHVQEKLPDPPEWPLISVLICTSGSRMQFTRKTLNGLAAQSYPKDRFEVIIVANRPEKINEDGLRAEAERLSSSGHNARFLIETDVGLSATRNLGIQNSRGEIIAFLDDDAIPSEFHLSNMARAFHAFPNAAIVGGPIYPMIVDMSERLATRKKERYKQAISTVDYGTVTRALKWPEHVLGANIAFRAKQLKALGGFNVLFGYQGPIKIGHDENFVTESLTNQGYDMIYSPSIPVDHLISPRRVRPYVLQQRSHFAVVTKVLVKVTPLQHEDHVMIKYIREWQNRLKVLPCLSNLATLSFCHLVATHYAIHLNELDHSRLVLPWNRVLDRFEARPVCNTRQVMRSHNLGACKFINPPNYPFRYWESYRCLGNGCYFDEGLAKRIADIVKEQQHVAIFGARDGQFAVYFLSQPEFTFKVEAISTPEDEHSSYRWSSHVVVQSDLTFSRYLPPPMYDSAILLAVKPSVLTDLNVMARLSAWVRLYLIVSLEDGSPLPAEVVSSISNGGFKEVSDLTMSLRHSTSNTLYAGVTCFVRDPKVQGPPIPAVQRSTAKPVRPPLPLQQQAGQVSTPASFSSTPPQNSMSELAKRARERIRAMVNRP